ncbi:hypothetical protein E3E35_08060 [Thermococcus sp. GR7]|uniref:hypothetical protein n=1 Tax=unclassified Thermococcus TaxID=2627626 RepID=UPI0014301E30|nr:MULTISPECIES: hypothetical protein [unclassified Thermococcus]NJE47352.1 hypothetical protein [Thermococcus sp. GR7]NJE78847.1 hypothetical protein [Thermococcus sp. GR4]NJF23158.1 hypothetical protein [Thermococcus sp. GR5]
MKFYAYFSGIGEEYLVIAKDLKTAARAALAHFFVKHYGEELPEGSRFEIMPLADAYRRGFLVNAEVAFLEEVTYEQAFREFKELLDREAQRRAAGKVAQAGQATLAAWGVRA